MKKFKRKENGKVWTEEDLGLFPEIKNALKWGFKTISKQNLRAYENRQIIEFKKKAAERGIPFSYKTWLCHPGIGWPSKRIPIMKKLTSANNVTAITEKLLGDNIMQAGIVIWGAQIGNYPFELIYTLYAMNEKNCCIKENLATLNSGGSNYETKSPIFILPVINPSRIDLGFTGNTDAIKQLWESSNPKKCRALGFHNDRLQYSNMLKEALQQKVAIAPRDECILFWQLARQLKSPP